MYEKVEKLMASRGVSAYKVAKDLGFSQSLFTGWKKNQYEPKADKIQKIADYFGVPVSYFYGEEDKPTYYLDDETAEMAQALHDDPNLRAMFKATRKLSKEDIETFTKLIEGFKNER